MKMRTNHANNAERGMTLVELLIALSILVIGLGAIMLMITTAIASNNGSKHDTNGTMLAQMIAEQIGSVPASSVAPVTVIDCTGAIFNVNTAGAAGPNGAGALLIAPPAGRAGEINWLGQDFAAVPANYRMRFTACGAGGRQSIYEVRWNVINLFQMPGPPVQVATKLVTVSARRRDQANPGAGSAGLSQIAFKAPVTIRTIVGQ